MPKPKPIYTSKNISPAYQLNWGLTLFWRDRVAPPETWLSQLKVLTVPDGVRILHHRTASHDSSQFFVSTVPHVSPAKMIRSVKGRLQYLLRDRSPNALRRNYDVHSIGSADREVIENYVGTQLTHHPMADPNVHKRIEAFQQNFDADFSDPQFSAQGRYRYNLHIVLVNEARWNEISKTELEHLADAIQRTAKKHTHRLSQLALLSDHLHFTVGCNGSESPLDIALSYQNNAASISDRAGSLWFVDDCIEFNL